MKTMDDVIGRLFLINYSLGTNSSVKPFKQLEVALENPRFAMLFRTWRTEGPKKNNLQADGLQ